MLQIISTPSEDLEVNRIAELIRADATLSAELLRRANSAMYGSRSEIGSLDRAIVMIGTDQVKSLVMTVAVGAYVKASLKITALRRCWRHSLACAMVSERLAPAYGVRAEYAYTAGLLHDIGRLGLLVKYPRSYADLLTVCVENDFDMMESERDLFDVDHPEAGAWLARNWQFPSDLIDVMAHHHNPENANACHLLDLVHISCRIADRLGFDVAIRREAEEMATLQAKLPEPLRPLLDGEGEGFASELEEKIRVME